MATIFGYGLWNV